MEDKLAYTIPQACAAAGIGRTTLYELLQAGELSSFTVGTRRLIPRAALEDFVARRLAAANGGRDVPTQRLRHELAVPA